MPALSQESQCFSLARGVSTCLVCCGILVYAQGKTAAKAALAGGGGSHHGEAGTTAATVKARHSFTDA